MHTGDTRASFQTVTNLAVCKVVALWLLLDTMLPVFAIILFYKYTVFSMLMNHTKVFLIVIIQLIVSIHNPLKHIAL